MRKTFLERMTFISWLFQKCGVKCNGDSEEVSREYTRVNGESCANELKVDRRRIIIKAIHTQLTGLQKQISDLVESDLEASESVRSILDASDLVSSNLEASILDDKLWEKTSTEFLERIIGLRTRLYSLERKNRSLTADPGRAWILPSRQASSISTNPESGDTGYSRTYRFYLS